MKNKNKKISNQAGFTPVEILIVIAVVGLIAGVGYTAYNAFSRADSKQLNSISSNELLENSQDEIDQILGLPEMQKIAVAELANTDIIGIELEVDDGVLVYVVHYADGSSLVFDAISGSKLELADNNNDEIEDGEIIPAYFVADVSIQEAIAIAKEQRPGSQLRKVEIELEDGVVVYSVRFTDDSRVDVRASDGEIQRLRDESGENVIKLDDDFDDDGKDNPVDSDDDNDGRKDSHDSDDDNDGRNDDRDDDDDNDGKKDSDDNDDDEDRDNSGSSRDDDDRDDDDRSGSNSGSSSDDD